MAVVFQYGSNMSTKRLNSSERLAGNAKVIGVAKTVEKYELAFTVWSNSNNCAAADILLNENGRAIYGVLYEIPDELITRESAKRLNAKSLDAIEGEGTNYIRKEIHVLKSNGEQTIALTYTVKNPQTELKTNDEYVSHILSGMQEHDLPSEYRDYVFQQILANNPELNPAVNI